MRALFCASIKPFFLFSVLTRVLTPSLIVPVDVTHRALVDQHF
jgi:hypothetical protein